MKKTIIASAIAAVVAAPAAFAEVTISGNVNMEILDQDASTGWDNSTNTDLVFQASEDLGNGMKAGMKYHMFHDDGADSVADTTVFLSGDFGTINAGRQESVNMAFFHGFAAGDAAHDMTLEDTNGNQSRMNAVAYTTPSMNGLTVTAVAGIGAGDQAGTAGTDTDNVDASEFVAKYSNGPLMVAIGKTTAKSSNGDEEVVNIAASYKMGDLKISVLNRDVDNSYNTANNATQTDNEMTTVAVNYTMGNNSLYAGLTDSDDGQDGDWVVSLAHNLSKRTSVYVAAKNDDDDDNTDTLIGVKHSF